MFIANMSVPKYQSPQNPLYSQVNIELT